MKLTRTPIASAVALALVGVVASAQAQTAPAKDLNTVTVTGIRASLETAVGVKRNADSFVDAVSAEDVGKLPDNDVGQSLGRIPGVAVAREFGQGASVSIRGSDPQMTFTTLNGQTVASTGWYDQKAVDRSFNYSLLPSELIGGMEVYKSSQADLVEGGIGGTVIVKTRKPLDMAANSGYLGVKLSKGTVSSDLDKDVSGLYSWRNDEKTFGVLVSSAVDQGDYIRKGIEADQRWSGDFAPSTFVQERKRDALNVTLQAKPAAGVDLSLNYLKLKLVGDNSNTSQYIFTKDGIGFLTGYAGPGPTNCTASTAGGACLKANATVPEGVFYQTWARVAEMTSDSFTLNGSYKGDGIKVEGVAGRTTATGGTSFTTNYQYVSWADSPNLPGFTGTIDATGKQVVINPSSNQTVTTAMFAPQISPAGAWAIAKGPNADTENFAQADATVDLDWGMLNSFKTGVRVTKHENTKESYKAKGVAAGTVASAGLYSGSIPLGSWEVPKPNIGAMVGDSMSKVTGWVYDRSAYGNLTEDNKAVYGMFNFEQGPVRGNFGLRYISTDVRSQGYGFDLSEAGDGVANAGYSKKLSSVTSSYNDVLPSLNAAYNLDKSTVVRFAASQAVTRANFDQMFMGASFSGRGDDTNAANDAITIGNPALKPQKSTQFDVGLEYYYGKGNLIAVTYFHKDIDNFVTTDVKTGQQIGIVSADSGKDLWAVNSYRNAGGGKIDGLEFQINHAFDNGFGAQLNYTYADATAPSASYADKLNLFTQSSKNTANVVGYWEGSTLSARLAYNWRSEYMIREAGWYGNRMHDAYGTLDLSAGWKVNDKVSVNFEALNLTKADDIQYGAGTAYPRASLVGGYPAWSFSGETTYRVSLSAKF